jgi:uncharacterized protein (PEP-CTERM system associated)
MGASSLPLAAPLAMLALLMAPSARAEVKVAPSLDLRETYSDNPGLQAGELARPQFITEVAPSLRIAADGPRLKGFLSLTEHLFAFSGKDIDSTRQSSFQLQGNVKARLVSDLLYVDGNAMIGQQTISPFAPPSNTNPYSNVNRAKIRTWTISPYLTHRFGAGAAGELRYTHDSVGAAANGFGSSVGNALAASLASTDDAQRRFGWNLRASRQDVEFTQGNQTRTREENIAATGSVRTSERFKFNVTGGYDSYDFNAEGTPNAGRSYSAGFTWTPSARTSVDASAGRRYYGNSYALNASHRSSRTVWIATYNDGITNSRQQLLVPKFIDTASVLDRLFIADIPDPVARRQAVDAYMRANGLSPTQPDGAYNYLSNRFLLQKQALLSAAFNTARSTALVSLNGARRTALTSSTIDDVLLGQSLAGLNDNTKQVGASASLNYRASSRTGLTMMLSRTRIESLTTGLRNNVAQASVMASTQLQRKLKASVELRRNQGNLGTAGASTYHENAISASLSFMP